MNFCKDCKYCRFQLPFFIQIFFPSMWKCYHPKYIETNLVTGKTKNIGCNCCEKRFDNSECSDFQKTNHKFLNKFFNFK